MVTTVYQPQWKLDFTREYGEEQLCQNGKEESKLQIPKDSLWVDGWSYHAGILPAHVQNVGLCWKKGSLFSDSVIFHNDESSAFVVSLRQCALQKDLCRGSMLYDQILELGLLHQCLDALVHMFAKCGELTKAQELLDMHESRNVSCWTTLIDGYTRQGQGQNALNCFDKMLSTGLSPDAVTYACILKACGTIKAVEKGKEIHDAIVKQGLLGTNRVLATALIDMYAKCGSLAIAHSVLEEIPYRDTASWNVLIAGYTRQRQGMQALHSYEQMRSEGLLPDAKTFACILKACGTLHAIEKGQKIHEEIMAQGLLTNDIVLGNALVHMYVKCGALAKAHSVVRNLSLRDSVTWNTIMAGYVQQGQGEQALNCFEQMQNEALPPDAVTFTCILRACGSIKAIDKGEQIHDEIMKQGLLENNIVLCNALIDMYAKCHNLTKAWKVFEEMSSRDVVSWNALITGYVQQDEGTQALNCFRQMKQEGCSPDAVTFACVLKACGVIRAIDEGEQVHDEIVRQGLLKDNIVLSTALVDMYANCGALAKAQQMLENLPFRDVVSWNTLISGYLQEGQAEQVLICFEKMQHEGLSPDAVTFSCILRAYGMMGYCDKVEQIYEEIERQRLLENDMVLCTAIVDAYAKCGALTKARSLLDRLPSQSIASWSALIAGYVQQGHCEHALICFEQMKQKGFLPDAVTFACILKACGTIGTIDKGEQIHGEIARHRLQVHSMLGNALVDMYAKCGALAKAVQVLEELPVVNVVSWNTLIAGYVQQGQGEQALKCFEEMQQGGLFPDEVTFACILKACATMGAMDKGEQIHGMIMRREMLGNNAILGAALVDMYAKGGALMKARHVLEQLPCRDVVVWSALIAGYAQWGQGKQVLRCLEHMQNEGLSPNLVTFSCVLNACSRLGLVEDGYKYFVDMITRYGIEPSIEHYACLIDLFGRAGHLEKAIKVIHDMPHSHYRAAWSALLCACQKWGDVNVGRWAFEQVIKADRSDAAAYVLMANIYATAGMPIDAEQVNAMRMEASHSSSHDIVISMSHEAVF